MGKLGLLLDLVGSAGKSAENGADISTILHGDDSKLVLLVDPGKESLGIIVENASALGPLAVKAASLEEAIALLE